MKPPVRDTIVALSSSAVSCLGNASSARRDVPRAIIRLSGPSAPALAAQIFSEAQSAAMESIRGWRRLAGEVRWKQHVFPAHAYVMRSPRSYTREDVIELHVPGIPWLLSSLLDQLLAAGARLAQAGEFTRRALENGRISIDQAEAVGALISSRTADEARKFAQRLHAQPNAARRILRGDTEELLSQVELGLDFSHEDVGVLPVPEILSRIVNLHRRAEEFSADSSNSANHSESAILNAGLPRILLLGPANAGKSSLFNRLLGRDAAIVSHSRHTTRDTVEALLQLEDGGSAWLMDSAGCGTDLAGAGISQDARWLRDAGWNATLSAVRCADIILLTFDRSQPHENREEAELLARALMHAKPVSSARVQTKSDLPSAPVPDRSAIAGIPAHINLSARFEVSSVTGSGIDALRTFLAAQISTIGSRPADTGLSAATAARAAVKEASTALARARDALSAGDGEDVAAVELREAIHAFSQADGILLRHDAVTEAALDRIFSQFCIGK